MAWGNSVKTYLFRPALIATLSAFASLSSVTASAGTPIGCPQKIRDELARLVNVHARESSEATRHVSTHPLPAAAPEITLHPAGHADPITRASLIEALKATDIPAYLKKTRSGDIPVILVNSSTAPRLQTLLDRSIGTQVKLLPENRNDHGLLRLKKWIIDLDQPGARFTGELHGTGISWRGLDRYLAIRTENPKSSDVVAEVLYSLRPFELEDAEYYQRVRRAAVIRVPFKLGDKVRGLDLPNMVLSEDGMENCFGFCKASKLGSQIKWMEQEIRAHGVTDVDQLMQSPAVKTYLGQARQAILSAEPFSMSQLDRHRLEPYVQELAPSLNLKPGTDPRTFAHWLVGLDATKKYQTLMRSLGVSSDVRIGDIHNPQATALLIYDSPAAAAHFNAADYVANGKGTSEVIPGSGGPWKIIQGDQTPLHRTIQSQ